jgi:hypothetical protein
MGLEDGRERRLSSEVSAHSPGIAPELDSMQTRDPAAQLAMNDVDEAESDCSNIDAVNSRNADTELSTEEAASKEMDKGVRDADDNDPVAEPASLLEDLLNGHTDEVAGSLGSSHHDEVDEGLGERDIDSGFETLTKDPAPVVDQQNSETEGYEELHQDPAEYLEDSPAPFEDEGPPVLARPRSKQAVAKIATRRGDQEAGSAGEAVHVQRRPEPTGEFRGATGAQLPAQYVKWNEWIVEHLSQTAGDGSEVYLSIAPTVLAAIAEEVGGFTLSPNEAEADFVVSVATLYASIIVREGRLRLLRTFDEGGRPMCAAFLAASVLAAYRMQTDENAFGGAYYYRLAELLKCELASGYPSGFDPMVFESLWGFLGGWLSEKTGQRLAMPGPESGVRRFVAVPLLHVPLRRLDIEKLPTFFAWAGYGPGEKVPERRLLHDIDHWTRSYASLSAAGEAALSDERRNAVASQIAQEIAAWDGSLAESGGRRLASVELMLDFVRFQPQFFYLPRRPEGFPARFTDGERFLEALDERWYEQVGLLPEDGERLRGGFEWRSTDNPAVGFRRSPSLVVPLGPHPEYSYFVSRSTLPRGNRCAVLCHESIASSASEYLAATSGRACAASSHPNVPGGWRLFANIVPQHRVDVPNELEGLDLDSQISVVCSGGLRLGRRREWLLGAEPKSITVSGVDQSTVVTIDNESVPLSQDGTVVTDGRMFGRGVHTIEAGGYRASFEVVEPELNVPVSQAEVGAAGPVVLPPGKWTVVGANPGEISGVLDAGRQGAIFRPGFIAVWAVRVGAGPGAVVVSVAALPLRFSQLNERGRAPAGRIQLWASLIYSAAVRRPDLRALSSHAEAGAISLLWREYVKAAKTIKRQWRKRP